MQIEQVVPGLAELRRAFLDGREPDRLDALDPEGLDDRAESVHWQRW